MAELLCLASLSSGVELTHPPIVGSVTETLLSEVRCVCCNELLGGERSRQIEDTIEVQENILGVEFVLQEQL